MSKTYTFAAPIETLDELANIVKYTGRTLYHRTNRNADGTPQRWRINGQLKRWVRTPDRIRLPLAHGLYDHDAVESLDEFNRYFATSYTQS
jgi:hypothetical protein